ncbi:hypothetical protein DHODJN_23715 [Methylorubrum extorquens]
MGHVFWCMAAAAEALRKAGKVGGRVLCQSLTRQSRPELVWVREDGLQLLPVTRLAKVIKRQFVYDADSVVPICVNAEAFQVAHDQERRILKGDGVFLELCKGGL